MTAQEAKELTLEKVEQCLTKELFATIEHIKDNAEQGYFSCEKISRRSCSLADRLRQLGYSVSVVGNRLEISW